MNHSVSINSVLAWLSWGLAITCAGLDMLIPSPAITVLATVLVGAGATLHVRGFIQQLTGRESHAFVLGRESVRAIK